MDKLKQENKHGKAKNTYFCIDSLSSEGFSWYEPSSTADDVSHVDSSTKLEFESGVVSVFVNKESGFANCVIGDPRLHKPFLTEYMMGKGGGLRIFYAEKK